MAGLIPIPNTRISGLLARERLVGQFQADQLALFRLQDQISTGQRIILPSDDAPAALRAISLQRLIERKGQLEENVDAGLKFLAASFSSLEDTSKTLADIKGLVLGVAGTSTQEERDVVVTEVNRAIEQLLTTANKNFRGRYLFTGSQTDVKPYSFDGINVRYSGNERDVENFSDIGVLFASNTPGTDVFGGISQVVQGSVDLNPQLTSDTLLSSLRGGRGISPNGALTISDGTNVSVVDISTASSIGDVARYIETNPPAGRQVTVSITGQGLTLQLTDGGSGNLTVKEVASGTAARELGILEEIGVLTNPLVGTDLDPIALKTTQIDNLLGSKARVLVSSAGTNNDLLVEANANGTALDGVAIQFVDDALLLASSGLSAGNEVAVYNPSAQSAAAAMTFAGSNNDLVLFSTATGTSYNNVVVNVNSTASGGVPTAAYDTVGKVLTLNLESDGSSTANQVITAIAGLAGNPFTASLDTTAEGSNDGTGAIAPIAVGNFANTGNSGGAAKTLYVRVQAGVSNANQVLSAINTEGTFTAQLDALDTSTSVSAGTGVVSLAIPAGGPFTTSGGTGGSLDQTSGIRVVNGGATYDITFDAANTLEDLLNTINGAGAGLRATINEDGDGIDVRSRLSGSDFQIGELGGTTATQLGIRTYTQSTKLGDLNYGTGIRNFGFNDLSGSNVVGFNLPTVTGDDIRIHTLDNQDFLIDLSGANSVADVAAAINAVTGASVIATAVSTGNVSELQLVDTTTLVGSNQFSIFQQPDSLAAQYLGIVPNGVTSNLSPGNTITGSDVDYIDFTITAKDGQTFSVDLTSTNTVGEAISVINTALATVNVTAQLSANGNGIELVDTTGGGGPLTVTAVEGSYAAEDLGLISSGSTQNSAATGPLTGEDRLFQKTASVFTTLIQLRDSLLAGDIPGIDRALVDIEGDIDRVIIARADAGAREQGLFIAQRNLEDEDVQLRAALSDEIDVDLVEAISALTARQISLEASLRATANILQLSLLNFI